MYYVDVRTLDPGKNLFGLRTGPGAYQVWVMRDGSGTPVTRDGTKLDFDKRTVGMKVKKTYRPPTTAPGTFTREEAAHVAHQVGRYYLKLGDLVWTYAFVDGLNNPSFFER